MSAVRVLRAYHSAVVDEYRARERLLRERHGYDVHLITVPQWPEGGSLVSAPRAPEVPVRVIRTRGRARHPILFWYSTPEFRRALRSVRPHIVDLQEEPYSLAVGAALRAVRDEAPQARICLYTAQNILKRYPPPFRQLERRALSAARAAYPCSQEAAQVLRHKGFAGSLHVLPLGVSVPPRVVPHPRGTDALRVGFLGRLVPEKGADLAIRAFAAAADGLDASLELVGAGPQEHELRELARGLGIGSRVLFAGAVPQAEALERIGAYDAVVIPSLTMRNWKEQFGRVVAQALAAGTPVLASDSGALPEVLDDCGEIAREGDVGDFADKLARLLHDPGRRAELGRLGHRRAIERFSWERVVDGVAAMYREMLADG